MEKIRFLKDTNIYEGNVTVRRNIISILFNTAVPSADVLASGFELLNEHNGRVQGKFHGFNTIYREYEDNKMLVELSNDGSVYVAPEPFVPTVTFSAGFGGSLDGELTQKVDEYQDLIVPVPVAKENYVFTGWNPELTEMGNIDKNLYFQAQFEYVPTLTEIQDAKIAEMNATSNAAIQNGVDVVLTDGSVEHFTLNEQDQISLMGLQTMVVAGEENIPWHVSDETVNCKFYSNADMKSITETALAHVTWHKTYVRALNIYIRSMETKDEVNAVVYGMDVPEEFQSDPLKVMIAAQAAAESNE